MQNKSFFQKIILEFNKRNIRYILIGRQAVVLYGKPVTSFDYDLWVHPDDREKVFNILEKKGLSPSSTPEKKKPIVFFVKEFYKIDVFFVRKFGKLSFEECYERANIFKEGKFFIRVASPENLIKLKKMRHPLELKDKEDINFLKRFL
ncbi:MAG: hypothetical protein DRI36_01745 [Caldiserica bacterium]|nr:MAG: hypothetical protein DRI36_01745 [Caldisericota bacterium]